MTSPTQPAPHVKGSWEDLFDQARHLDANRNEEAVPIYQKLISRLSRLPESKRLAFNQRLQSILEGACLNCSALLNSLERFDESVAALTTLYEILPDEEEKRSALRACLRVLVMAGRFDEALSLLETKSDADYDSLIDRYMDRFGILIESGRLSEAEDVLADARATIENATYGATASSAEGEEARLCSMSAILAIHQSKWGVAVEQYERAAELSEDYRGVSFFVLYTKLVHHRQFEIAVPFIEQDALKPRRLFWQGLALYHSGQEEQARELWEQNLSDPLQEDERDAFLEYILTHFYLGDQQRLGLELLLRILNEAESPSWQLFAFNALGWGLRNIERNMLNNMDFAIDRLRRSAQGRYIPWTIWLFVLDLLDEQAQDKVRPYFDQEELARHYQMASSTEPVKV